MMIVAEEREPLDQETKMITLPHIAMQGQEVVQGRGQFHGRGG